MERRQHSSPGVESGIASDPTTTSLPQQLPDHKAYNMDSNSQTWNNMENAFRGHRRQPTDTVSDIPIYQSIDNDLPSPLLMAQQDPYPFQGVMQFGQFDRDAGAALSLSPNDFRFNLDIPMQNLYIPMQDLDIPMQDLERPEQLPSTNRNSSGVHALSPPEIIIDFAPPSRPTVFEPPTYPADIDALTPPDRSRARHRIKAKSDPFSDVTSAKTEDRSRAQSEPLQPLQPVPNRDYVLDLPDPSRLQNDQLRDGTQRIQKHPATFQCNLCPKRFTRAYNLRSHLRTHTDERPFICSVCGKAFARQHDRKRHEGLHEKFICSFTLDDGNAGGCGRRFHRADALGRHFRSEAGQICIKPLLEKEHGSAPRSKRGEDPLTGQAVFALPPALLQQHPALAHVDWTLATSDDSMHDAPSPTDFDMSRSKPFENGELFHRRSTPPILTAGEFSEVEILGEAAFNESRRPLTSAADAATLLPAALCNSQEQRDIGLPENKLDLPVHAGRASLDTQSEVNLVDSELAKKFGLPYSGRKQPAESDLDDRKGKILVPTEMYNPDEHLSLSNSILPEAIAPNPNDAPVLDPVPSDSGYHSGLGTDTESVCSMSSMGSSLGLPQNFLQEFVAYFGDTLIEKAGARQWAEYALLHHSPGEIEKRLNALLKDYAMDMASKPPHSWGSECSVATQHMQNPEHSHKVLADATSLIRRYRPKIARYFCENAVSIPVSAASLSVRLQELGQQLSLSERFRLLERSGSDDRDPTETSPDLPVDEEVKDDAEERELFADIRPIRDMLVSSEAFRQLTLDLRRALYHDDGLEMETIREAISENALPHTHLQAQFGLDWGLLGFMRSQYGDNFPRASSVVVLIGSAIYAQATTCGDYIMTTWPKTGPLFLEVIEGALQEAKKASVDVVQVCTTPLTRVRIEMSPHHSNFVFSVGTSDQMVLVELAQQLAWIGSALRTSPFGDQSAYAKPVLQNISYPEYLCSPSGQEHLHPTGIAFRITFEHKPLHATETACWLPLFSGAVIASGFPIPERADEIGLEISLDLMAGIAGVLHAVEYEGGVVMKGFSHMFVPVRKKDDRVQWHAISSQDPETRLTYRDALSRCNARALLKEVSLDDLRSTRAILGWCSVATSRLGSDSANYENIDYSGAKEADSTLRCAGGQLGFQQFGMAALDFRFGAKDGRCHFQRSGPYHRIVSAAEKTPVVLYDTGEQRAWLVSASEVMLHMVQHRHWLEPFEVDDKRIKLDTNVPTESSAKKILLRNEKLRLSDSEEFKDVILRTWSQLEFLIEQNVARDRNAPGTSMKGTLRDFLHGFEFKAVVQERSPFRLKEREISKTNGGWPSLVRDIDALVLLADGFGDILLPAEEGRAGLCRLWQRVPIGHDYLATSTKTLKELYDVAGCRVSRKYLTSTQLQWHQGDSLLFDACEDKNACRCNRLQQILPKSSIGTIVSPGKLVDGGAVVFGHSGSLLHDIMSKPRIQAPNISGIYSQPNVPLTPIVIRHEYEDSTFSDSSGRSGSDGTADSTPGSLSTCTTLSTQDTLADTSEQHVNLESTPFPRKRMLLPETYIKASDDHQEEEQEDSSICMHKRTKSMHADGGPDLSPLHSYRSGLEDLRAQRHGRSDSVAQRASWISKSDEELLDCSGDAAPALTILGKDGEYGNEGKQHPSSPLVVRLVGEDHVQPLRRRNGFHWKNSARGEASG